MRTLEIIYEKIKRYRKSMEVDRYGGGSNVEFQNWPRLSRQSKLMGLGLV